MGEEVYVLGDHSTLEDWNIEKGAKLSWSKVCYATLCTSLSFLQNNDWQGSIWFDRTASKSIEYKYVVYNRYTRNVLWEEGSNRQLHLFLVKPAKNELALGNLMTFNLQS